MKRRKTAKILVFAVLVFAVFQPFHNCCADTFSTSYQLLDQLDGSVTYRLNVIISQSLQDYYQAKNHILYSQNDFDKFVTPYALQPIADSLRQIYSEDEDFANGVLMIVHQIPYQETSPPLYPVETMVNNKGDCDLFSFIAASIVKAGGLNVVLLYYEQEAHMNIGVSLQSPPQDARSNVYFVTSANVRYYVAECTGGNWQNGWRVGECPDELRSSEPRVITLDNYERTATGQVSASYDSLAYASLTLVASATFAIQGSITSLSGRVSPILQDKTITMYGRVNNAPWQVIGTVATDSNGRFVYAFSPEMGGIWHVRASWSGDENYSSADSSILSITIMSTFLIMLIAAVIIFLIIGVVAYLASRRGQPDFIEPQPPEIPY